MLTDGTRPLGLQEAKVNLINLHVCNSTHWYAGAIHSHNLCAGYAQGRIDTCQVGACSESSTAALAAREGAGHNHPSSPWHGLALASSPWHELALASRPPTTPSPSLPGLPSPSPAAVPCPVPPLSPGTWHGAHKAQPLLLAAHSSTSQPWNLCATHPAPASRDGQKPNLPDPSPLPDTVLNCST